MLIVCKSAGATETIKEKRNIGITWEGKANIIDENTKQTIKGILGSFTLIDQHEVGERTFRVWWRDLQGKQLNDYIAIGQTAR